MKYLYLIVAILAVSVVGLNQYVVNYQLNRVLDVDYVQLQQFVANNCTDDVIYVCINQSDEIVTLNTRLDQTVNLARSLKTELEQAKSVIESDGEAVQELTNGNSDLQIECDSLFGNLIVAVTDYQKLRNDYDALQVKYNELLKEKQ